MCVFSLSDNWRRTEWGKNAVYAKIIKLKLNYPNLRAARTDLFDYQGAAEQVWNTQYYLS